ncbi:Aste57867_18541 [Aphanomyces stellatus]|uniref:Aste57867_18541 protein n=1 Tax=Aphanomyces stellatus TaxID=120398 RepID=A0A485LAD3_9STRA|nr:hypothetical protein As57867_018479 [Aphanomyces stellatus]VFT95277.1 Aste57867_18541 [Aphanomyces stellatus]
MEAPGPCLVEVKRPFGTSGYLYKVMHAHPKVHAALKRVYFGVTSWVGFGISTCVVVLVVLDTVGNNWAINDFIGNAQQFKTPVAKAASVLDLTPTYAFADGYNLSSLSNIGYWMTDSTIQNLVGDSSTVYILAGGTYQITGPAMNMCGAFAGSYAVNVSQPVKLGVAVDAMTYIRGTSLSHGFTDDLTTNLPNASSKVADAVAQGFAATRVQVDMKLTTAIAVANTSASQNVIVTWFRIYAKAYCTGCTPIAELGRGVCNLTMTYTDSSQTLQVTHSTYVLGSDHLFGLMISRDIYGTLSLLLRFLAIFIAAAGFLAGRKTVQWREASLNKVESMWDKVVDTIAPKYFPHMSHAIRFDLFCYNSDYFVLLIVVSTILDMNRALTYIREVNVFNENSPHFDVTLQLFALSSRFLWLNVGFVKATKLVAHLVYPATYSGESRLMPWLNLSSVTTMYLSGIMLFYIPQYIEYNNQCRWDVRNHNELLDPYFVNFFDSFYFRVATSVGIGLILNVMVFLALDHVALSPFWYALSKNSLSRQAIYNSTAVIVEFVDDVNEDADGNYIMHVKARRLSTLQWFFMSHTTNSVTTTKGEVSSTDKSANVVFMVGQADNGHLHLFDDNLADVKSLPFNIKVLRDTAVTIR